MKTPPPETLASLALLRLPGIGPLRHARALQRYGSAVAALAAVRDWWPRQRLDQLGSALETARSGARLDFAWQTAQPGRRLLCLGEPAYPPQLAALSDAPPVLFVEGDAELLARPQLALVGTRAPTPEGESLAAFIAADLVRAGLAVTSGLALGIDAAAHRGALRGGGPTLAVLGTGMDRTYPRSHGALRRAIVEQGGAIISEFSLQSPVNQANFPRRNRIVSGLALGVAVIEAALRSGALITAQHAADQGREVFALPGSVRNPRSAGCHRLIREGATLIESAADVLEQLEWRQAAGPSVPAAASAAPAGSAPTVEPPLLACFGYDPVSVDELVERSGLTPAAVSSMLIEMELDGLISPEPGGFYRRGA